MDLHVLVTKPCGLEVFGKFLPPSGTGETNLVLCCSQVRNPCTSNPCQNGATCQAIVIQDSSANFTCVCAVGFTGITCGSCTDSKATQILQGGGQPFNFTMPPMFGSWVVVSPTDLFIQSQETLDNTNTGVVYVFRQLNQSDSIQWSMSQRVPNPNVMSFGSGGLVGCDGFFAVSVVNETMVSIRFLSMSTNEMKPTHGDYICCNKF
jgi:hypothetical protein